MPNKKNIAILYGGRSVEHQISIRSARNIAENIDSSLYNAILIGITMEGNWYLTEGVNKDIAKGKELSLRLNSDTPKLIDQEGNSYKVDIAFPVLHGTDGEDGSIQGMMQVMNIPCVGSDVLGSAVSMNKLVTKQLLCQASIPIGDFIGLRKDESFDIDELISILGLPLVIKPASLGSSVGVSIAKTKQEVKESISQAFEFDSTLVAEQYIKGREIECAILGNENPEASLPGEIVVSSNYEFYSFDAKYVDPKAAKLEIPAKISGDIQNKIRELSIQSYQALKCCDYARVDLFLTPTGEIFINEINTIPGFTNSSMFPKMWENMGISYSDLISKLIALALERDAKNKELNRIYKSNLE